MKRKHLTLWLPLALTVGLLCFLGTRSMGNETATQVVQIATAEPASQRIDAAPGNASEIQDYGRRQTQNPGLSDFAGGHHEDDVVIVYAASSGCLLIAILVIVILL